MGRGGKTAAAMRSTWVSNRELIDLIPTNTPSKCVDMAKKKLSPDERMICRWKTNPRTGKNFKLMRIVPVTEMHLWGGCEVMA